MAKPLTLRLVQPEDQAQAIELMRELRISIGGIQDKSLYSAMCSSREICCVVAHSGQELAGIALVELNRRWIRRRPFLAARMVLSRLLRRKSSTAPSSAAQVTTPPAVQLAKNPPVRWSDSAPRVLFIGVHSAWRGQGVGKMLYNAMFDQIQALGSLCILARIATDNIASLHLHKETGWVLYEDEGVVFAVKSLHPAS